MYLVAVTSSVRVISPKSGIVKLPVKAAPLRYITSKPIDSARRALIGLKTPITGIVFFFSIKLESLLAGLSIDLLRYRKAIV